MITLILTIHLLLAATYTVSIIGLTIAAALKKAMPRVKTSAVASFATTIGSGVVLVAVSPKAMATFCTSTVIASLFGLAAWTVYKHRVAASHTSKSALY